MSTEYPYISGSKLILGTKGITGWSCSPGEDERRLKPLGLYCSYGHYDENKNRTYIVSNYRDFNVELSEKDFRNVILIYNRFLRKKKLAKIML